MPARRSPRDGGAAEGGTAEGVRTRHATVGGVRAHWLEAGARGTTVVLVHGLGNSGQVWRRVLPSLARHHRVVVPDLPGFGHSAPTAERPLLVAYSAFIEELCALAAPGERVALVGNSVGGAVALRLASVRPELVERLVLVDPAGVGHGVPIWWRLARIEPAVRLLSLPALALTPRPVVEAVVGAAYRRMAFHRPEAVSARTTRLFAERLASPRRIAHFLESAHDIVASFEREVQRLESPLDLPILVVWGRYDRLVPLSDALALLERVRAAELRIVEDAGHSPQLEQPVRFLAAVEPFLRGQRTAALDGSGVTAMGLDRRSRPHRGPHALPGAGTVVPG